MSSITGGPDAASPWTNLIRIKKVFPLQPAWETGKLKVITTLTLYSAALPDDFYSDPDNFYSDPDDFYSDPDDF